MDCRSTAAASPTRSSSQGRTARVQTLLVDDGHTPEYIELVPNAADKYVVASYTPGLVAAEDGSVTIYVQAHQPKKNTANWLPVPKGHFSLLFRVYG
ncbi:MAG TPA: DUF1214 domain-containing protein, partial [Thermoanaerobaculia bacterium]|nr:DUF1214 domain-containing protein [Thermoanaerobaculia bacterium]